MELIADLVRRRIPCCSQAARCSAGARFEHYRATSTTGRHPITDVGFLFAWARSCGACDTVSLMYPPWPCRHPPAPRPCPPVPPASSTPMEPGVLMGLARRLEARIGTTSAHSHGSRTPLPRCRLFLNGVTPFSRVLHLSLIHISEPTRP